MSEAAAAPDDVEPNDVEPNDLEPDDLEPEAPGLVQRFEIPIAIVLFLVTCVSTLYVGQGWAEGAGMPVTSLLDGWTFAVPLMAILVAHEMGHYVVGRLHGVDVSPPMFIPIPVLLGTMGAVIQFREDIERRNALLDIGAAGPLCGMAVALPVLAYGIAISPVQALADLPNADETLVEGRGLLYLGLLYLMKGPIPAGHDVMLGPTAMAGWAGLLVTMINLVPVGQLDGGHVAYALFGDRQRRYSRLVHGALPFIGLAVSVAYLLPAYARGERGAELLGEAFAGIHWITWAIVLTVLMRLSGEPYPETGGASLTPGRKVVAVLTLALFVLLFMPSWIFQPTLEL